MTIADAFKEALASWASGVSVVATRQGDLVYGMTVSSFASLSLDPPLVLACVASKSKLPPMVRAGGRFAVSLLSAVQDAASTHQSRSGRHRAPALGVDEARTTSGMPVVANSKAFLDCELHAEIPVGDHVILVGRVVEAVAQPDLAPLVYYRRRYRTLEIR
jgi:flavin reductase (DIM6/NTAB) family NADH-FMN oxidoreductase RutF